MNINKLVELSYSLWLHKTRIEYNATKYNFKVSSNMNKQMQIYFNSNKFNLQQIMHYDAQQTKLRLIISYFINNKQVPVDCTNKDYDRFIQHLTEYKNEFSIFFRKILENMEVITPIDLMRMYNKKEIPFYIFYYMLKYGGYEMTELTSELVKNRFIGTHKLMLLFKHFDEEYIKKVVEDIIKYIKLNSVKEIS